QAPSASGRFRRARGESVQVAAVSQSGGRLSHDAIAGASHPTLQRFDDDFDPCRTLAVAPPPRCSIPPPHHDHLTVLRNGERIDRYMVLLIAPTRWPPLDCGDRSHAQPPQVVVDQLTLQVLCRFLGYGWP